MLKTFTNNDGKITVAVIEGTKYNAIKKVAKKLHLGDVIYDGDSISFANISGSELPKLLRLDMLIMPNRFTGKVVCNEQDEPDDEAGRAEAIRKVKQHYNSSLNRAILRWQNKMTEKLKDVNPITYKEITRWYR